MGWDHHIPVIIPDFPASGIFVDALGSGMQPVFYPNLRNLRKYSGIRHKTGILPEPPVFTKKSLQPLLLLSFLHNRYRIFR
jgi:hypothetical protein